MKNGFLKVAAISPKVTVCDCDKNKEAILNEIKKAAENGVKLVVFPELSITGYTCGDLFMQTTLLRGAINALCELTESTKGLKTVAVVGVPLVYGNNIYNCAAVIFDGQILGVVPKSNLPNYNEFYERRIFTPAGGVHGEITIGDRTVPFGVNQVFRCADMPMFSFAIEICEDLWVSNSPSITHAAAGANIICNLSASNDIVGKENIRRTLISAASIKLKCAYVYSDAGEGESTTDIVFGGHNLICELGRIIAESRPFAYTNAVTEIDLEKIEFERRKTHGFVGNNDENYNINTFSLPLEETKITRTIKAHPFIPTDERARAERCEFILKTQAEGLKTRLEKGNFKAVIGVSGGLDSTLALLVAHRAMSSLKRPLTDIIAVTMPCFGTSGRTMKNSINLCKNLNIDLRTVDISEAVKIHLRDIGHPIDLHDVTYENSQARERTQVLMDIANSVNGLVVGTGDLSELALGFATYNGDHMSMYGVNASIPKTLVRVLVEHVAKTTDNKALSEVLFDILDTPVSPELLPPSEQKITQKTEDIIGPYELHDFFLYYFMRYGFTPRKIFRMAKYAFGGKYDDDTILKWLKLFFRRFFTQQFKRSCMPDGAKVGVIALSPRGDFRMPSDAQSTLWLNEIDEMIGENN